MSRVSLRRSCTHHVSRLLIPLAVALCAYFAAQGLGRLALAQLRLPAPFSAVEPRGASPAQPLADTPRQTEAIVQRNLFCSNGLAAEASVAGVEPPLGELISDAQLLATVIPERATTSPAFAALHPSGAGSWRVVSAGDELQPGVQVRLVTSTGVVLERGGRQQIISLAGTAGGASLPPVAPATAAQETIIRSGDTRHAFTIR